MRFKGIDTVVIVIHYGRSELTHRAVASVLSGSTLPRQIVVIDNGPGEFEADPGWPAWVAVHHAGANLGFAAGVNAAIRLAPVADGYWLLNNDAMAHPDALEQLELASIANPRSLVSSIVLDDSGVVWFEQARYLPWRAHARHEPATHHSGEHTYTHASWRGIPYLPGTSLYLPQAAIREIGLLDEAFFLYGEDIDYSIRALRQGWSLMVARSSRVSHTASSGTERSARQRMIAAAVLRITARYYPVLVFPGLAAGLLSGARRSFSNRDVTEFGARAAGYLDALRGTSPRRP